MYEGIWYINRGENLPFVFHYHPSDNTKATLDNAIQQQDQQEGAGVLNTKKAVSKSYIVLILVMLEGAAEVRDPFFSSLWLLSVIADQLQHIFDRG